MDKFDTSFIPQQPLLKVEGAQRFKEQINLPLIISFLFLFISVLVFAGLFFYEMNVERRTVALEKTLEEKEATLNIPEIERYKKIDERLSFARGILEGHIAFSAILSLLEKITAENVGFTSLAYAPNEAGAIEISLSGQAPNYAAVYVQAEAWRGMRDLLKEVDVSLPMLNPDNGVVSFGATLTVDTGYAKYARTVREQGSTPAIDTGSEAETATNELP